MYTQTIAGNWKAVAATLLLTLSPAGSAIADPAGGHGAAGGASHGGGVPRGAVPHGGGGFHPGGGFRTAGPRGYGQYLGGGYYRGGQGHGGVYDGGYGYRGSYDGWRGGWSGAGLGWYLPILPLGYATLWWGGVPYYFAGDSYYLWDDSVGEYQAVEPPAGPSESAPTTSAPNADPAAAESDLFAYPKAGQSDEQQARDRDECRKWAAIQPGSDPTESRSAQTKDAMAKRKGYLRAETACLEGRNYDVK
jgi:hypothetical protein